MLTQMLLDALFAALAAIGFAAISRPPRRGLLWIGLIAAVAHSSRFLMLNAVSGGGMNIIAASFLASTLVGILAVFVSPLAKMPAEACLFPSLLPMIPGIYAYKSFGGLALSLLSHTEKAFDHYFSLFALNGATCLTILLAMVTGATLPIFLLSRISFTATR